jgi:heme-degrading monooxygenase HmoA
MLIALTTRRLKPGEWDGFRAAWEPKGEEYPPGFVRAVHARNVNDPDEIVSFGMFDASREDLAAWRERNAAAERLRQESMARHVASTGADAFYEIVEEVTPER